MPGRPSLRRARSVLSAEFDAIRRRAPDLDAGDLVSFSLPLTLGLLGIIAVGVVPLIVVSISAESDALLVPLVGSFALAAICTAVIAWLTALVIASAGWSLATIVGPFETTRMITLLLNGWLPPVVDGRPRAQVIADLLPARARWWAVFGPLPVIAIIWAYEAWRNDGLVHIRRFLAEDDTTSTNST